MPGDNHVLVPTRPPEDEARVLEARSRLLSARARTEAALGVLSRQVQERMDWQTWYRARPGAFLAAAFLLGFLLAKRR